MVDQRVKGKKYIIENFEALLHLWKKKWKYLLH